MSDEKKDKERKGVGLGAGVGGNAGGAAPQWMSAAAKVGAGQSSGSGNLLLSGLGGKKAVLMKIKSILMTKTIMFSAVTGGMIFSGQGINDMRKRGFGVEVRQEQTEMFAQRKAARTAAAIDVPGGEPAGKSALELAQEANEGTYGAEPAASADAPKDTEASEDVDAPEAEGSAAGGMDADSLTAQMMENMGAEETSKAKNGLGKKFGSLSQNIGGGSTKAKLSGGPGLAGGINKTFSGSTLSNKRLTAMRTQDKSNVSRAMTAARSRGGKTSGSNAQKLAQMSKAMRGSRNASATEQADIHTQQWSGGDAGGGGPGRADTTAGAISGDEGGGGGNPLTSSGGGGYGGGYDQGYEQGYGTGGAPPINGVNITPYQQMVDMAAVLLQLVSALLLAATLFGLWAKAAAASILGNAGMSEALYAIAKYLAYAAAALAAILTLVGVGIMMQGQTTQGAIYTGIGALMTILAYTAAESYSEASANAGTAAEKAAESGAKEATGKLADGVAEGAKEGVKEAATASDKAFLSAGKSGLTGNWISGVGGGIGEISSPIMDHNADGYEQDYKDSSGWTENQKKIDDYQARQDQLRAEQQAAKHDAWDQQYGNQPAYEPPPSSPEPGPNPVSEVEPEVKNNTYE
jgi:hypothetical protein